MKQINNSVSQTSSSALSRVAAAVLVSLAALDMATGVESTPAIVARGCLLVFGSLAWFFFGPKRADSAAPGVVQWAAALGFGLQGGLFCLVPLLWLEPDRNPFGVEVEQVAMASQVTLVAFTCFLTPSLFLGKRQRKTIRLEPDYRKIVKQSRWLIILSGILYVANIYMQSDLALAVARMFSVLGAMALVFSASRIGDKYLVALGYLVPLAWGIIDVLSRGQRGSLIAGYLPIAFAHTFGARKVPKGLIIYGVTAAALLIFLLPAINNFREQGLVEISVQDLRAETERQRRASVGSEIESVLWIVTRASYIPTLAVIVDKAQAREMRYNGESYLALPLWLVPRALYRNKPEYGSGALIASEYFGWNSASENRTAGVAPSIQGEAYANFGMPGVLIVMTLFGLFYRMLDRLMDAAFPLHFWLFIAISYYGIGIAALEQCADQLLILTKWPLIFSVPVLYVLQRKLKPKALAR